MGKNEKNREKLRKPTWGTVCCAECEKDIAFFPPNVDFSNYKDLELYCSICHKNLKGKIDKDE